MARKKADMSEHERAALLAEVRVRIQIMQEDSDRVAAAVGAATAAGLSDREVADYLSSQGIEGYNRNVVGALRREAHEEQQGQ